MDIAARAGGRRLCKEPLSLLVQGPQGGFSSGMGCPAGRFQRGFAGGVLVSSKGLSRVPFGLLVEAGYAGCLYTVQEAFQVPSSSCFAVFWGPFCGFLGARLTFLWLNFKHYIIKKYKN